MGATLRWRDHHMLLRSMTASFIALSLFAFAGQASARLAIAPLSPSDDSVIQVRGGHGHGGGHGWHGNRGHHYGWYRGRGNWRHHHLGLTFYASAVGSCHGSR